ncbi:uncharacterized protein LOC131012406 [Salvia miltiorrhiza]|uniref:uncharacterized protein LOC131012406 n=1 Tax=Salvia miltiorrhiza TaxID=226208 RepID=UPI0025ABB8EC|nr:uncharacterized protein LOC131012406 [Salvia miltiorrhiza]
MSTIWNIWHHRNKVVFDDAHISAVSLTVQIKAFILEASRFSLGEMANSVEKLLVLHDLRHKINIDGSVHGLPLCIHAGDIIRDSNLVIGRFHFSVGREWAFEAELFVLIIALEQVVSQGWDYIWIETDCTYPVDLFRTRSTTVPWRFFSTWRKIIQDIFGLHITISHIFREGNRVADFLASSVTDEGFWPFAIPDILQLVWDNKCFLPYVRIVA